MAIPPQPLGRRLRGQVLGVMAVAIGMALTGCIVESPRPRYWIENNSLVTIVVRQSTKVGYLSVTEMAGRQKVEVRGLVHAESCDSGFEIVDASNKKLRTLDKVCDGDTIVYP